MATGYSIKEFTTGAGGDAGYNTEYALVDPKGNRVAEVRASQDDSGNFLGYYLDNSSGSGESDSMGTQTPIDLDAINARAEKGTVPFGTGMGPALGYAYGMKNSSGDIFRKFDAKGNLTEFLDEHGKFQPASSFQPTGMQFNASTGNFETTYKSPNSPRENITESTATTVNRYAPTSGGWLGEGGWKNIGMLVVAGLSAGAAAYLNAAGAAASGTGGLTSLGSSTAEAIGAMQAFETGLSATGSLVGAETALSQYLTDVGSQFSGVVGDSGSSMLFDDLVQAVGISPDQVATGFDVATEIGTKVGDLAIKGYDQATQTDTSAETAPVTPTTSTGIETLVNPPPPPADITTEAQADEVDPIAVPMINQLRTDVERYEAAGMERDEAINQAITDLSNKTGQDKQDIIAQITAGDAALYESLQGFQTDLTGQITDLGTDLGGQITEVRDDLTGEIIGVRDDLTGQITDVGTQVTDLTTDFNAFDEWSKQQEDNRQKKERGKEAIGLLSQMASGSVKTPEVAKIDYMFDIGGDSVFATPKQESLMPSPFEETPEAVEGAMPRYQYYAPGGGYTYADGGFIEDEYTIDDLYRMLGSK